MAEDADERNGLDLLDWKTCAIFRENSRYFQVSSLDRREAGDSVHQINHARHDYRLQGKRRIVTEKLFDCQNPFFRAQLSCVEGVGHFMKFLADLLQGMLGHMACSSLGFLRLLAALG